MPIPAGLKDESAILALRQYGRDARGLRDLYVQMYLHCGHAGTDGFVPDGKLMDLVTPDPPRVAQRDVKRLADAGLVERAVGGWVVPAYLAVCKTRAEAERQSAVKSEGARLANHDRWHVKRGETDPKCPYCQTTDQSTDQYGDQTTDQTTDEFTDQYSDGCTDQTSDQITDPGGEAVLFKRSPPVVPPTAGQAADPDPHFTEFWGIYPRKAGKPRARKAWRAAMRRKDDPALIIKAATAYRDDPRRRSRDIEFTAHPSTWLNDERYKDAPPAAESATDDDDFWGN